MWLLFASSTTSRLPLVRGDLRCVCGGLTLLPPATFVDLHFAVKVKATLLGHGVGRRAEHARLDGLQRVEMVLRRYIVVCKATLTWFAW